MTMTELERPQVRAVAKWVRISPRKARLVIDHIRGRTVPEARTVLAFTTRAAAREIEKVLRSAVANAEANHQLIGDELFVAEALVDEGVTIKRWQPRARGRVARIKKRTCHITIKLSPVDGFTPPPPPAPVEVEPEVEEVDEAPTTVSAGALTPEEQTAAAAKPKRAPRAKAAPKAEAPKAEETEKEEAPKKRAPRVRKKKEEESKD
jgi:large subunit ribosomal protein L22